MSLSLPACCHALDASWPWQTALSYVRSYSVRFDRQRLVVDDFIHSGIPLPDTLRNAAPKRQAEYLAGRLCAREALQRLTGTPHVPGMAESKAPLWPSGTVGSITHSGDLAAAMVAPTECYQGVGLDAERQLELARAERLAPQILTPAERDLMAALPVEQQAHFVTAVFSLKESLFKALFPLVNVRFYFQDAQLIDWNPDAQQTVLRLNKTLSEHWPAGSLLSGRHAHLEAYVISLIAIPA
ncbi:4'-phosphopantetheinyl transferase family protein [Modicisalibacter luteus]|uniref:Enterobactin synthase component D n=1 Tax=Modicisalibacter luteus TaxID=453962 RepID=A0ABV7M5B7_9GAMM|nr:4'-phosphopantetheinyl transferase superfamily protein [Halomonas lutea]GHB07809.1 4'-phosphopantetheinyl transferase [Halomonas lutea]